jgi:dolichol-phosphate mannosyltransferase
LPALPRAIRAARPDDPPSDMTMTARPPAGPLRVLACPVAYNEAGKIGQVLDRFRPGDVDEILVLDDGSTDATAEEAESRGVAVLRHAERRGVGAAIRSVIQYARSHAFQVVVILAGNDKDRPQEIPRLLAPIRDGYDLVQGSRYLPGGDYGNMPIYRRMATEFVHPWLFSLVARRRITDSTNGFRAFRLSVLDDANMDIDQEWLDTYELEPYLFLKAIRLGYRVTEVPVTKIYPPHELGYTKMTPIIGWWSILRPIVLLGLGLRR